MTEVLSDIKNLDEEKLDKGAMQEPPDQASDRDVAGRDCGERGLKGGSDSVSLTLTYKSTKHPLTISLSQTVEELKTQIATLTEVPSGMQKLIMPKGNFKDGGMTLAEAGVTEGSRIMLVGSTLSDIMKANQAPTAAELAASNAKGSTPTEKICERKEHRKVLDKGVPDDAVPGILDLQEELPPDQMVKGMRNKQNSKLRLTFKLELDQLWIGTPERTEKVPMASIHAVVSETIPGHEQYHILGLQLGPTEASRLWIYWVPAQYVGAIKRALR